MAHTFKTVQPVRRILLIRWPNGYRPFCDCGWDDGVYPTEDMARAKWDQHDCLVSNA